MGKSGRRGPSRKGEDEFMRRRHPERNNAGPPNLIHGIGEPEAFQPQERSACFLHENPKAIRPRHPYAPAGFDVSTIGHHVGHDGPKFGFAGGA